MQKRLIKTKLFGKNELFRTLALAETTGYPALFVGIPGTAKTQILLDYAGAKFKYNKEEVRDNSFIIELDEHTRSSEIKGQPDMAALVEQKKFQLDSRIARSKFIMINEVDKGTSGVRNTLLSIMREKCLFLGSEIKRCDWEIFVGSCNMISNDESDKPFFDRFVLKKTVDRIGKAHAMALFNIHNINVNEFEINMPTKEELKNEQIDENLLNILSTEIYDFVSDRTMTYIPSIVKAIKLIWEVDDEEACVLAVGYICPEISSTISSKLINKEKQEILSRIEKLTGISDVQLFRNISDEINNMITSYAGKTKNHRNYKQGLILKAKLEKSNEAFMKSLQEMMENSKGTANKNMAFTPTAEVAVDEAPF